MHKSEPNDFCASPHGQSFRCHGVAVAAADDVLPGTGTESDTNLEELSGSYSASDDFSSDR